MTEHSPLPWRVGDSNLKMCEQENEIRQGDKVLFSGNSNFYDQGCIDAKFVVDAVNSYDQLKSENAELKARIEKAQIIWNEFNQERHTWNIDTLYKHLTYKAFMNAIRTLRGEA